MTKICVKKPGQKRWHRVTLKVTRTVADAVKECRLRGFEVKTGLA